MRVRPWRPEDVATLFVLHTLAATTDGSIPMQQAAFESWLHDIAEHEPENAFIVTDDDDELMTWSQAGTLEGIEGETIGYTILQLNRSHNHDAYHFLCQGTVHPHYRRHGAGRLLLISARNRARLLASDFEFEAEQAGIPVYFEALLPTNDAATRTFAARFEMQLLNHMSREGLYFYQAEL
jgi:GNAT superfamily N-acetyltransferase